MSTDRWTFKLDGCAGCFFTWVVVVTLGFLVMAGLAAFVQVVFR